MHFYMLRLRIALLAVSSAIAGDALGTFDGLARDGTGAVLPGATILIQHWKLNSRGRQPRPVAEPLIYSDSSGRFVARLPPGLYDVFVSYPTLSPIAKKIKVESGKETSMDCQLPFSPLVESVE
jgi:hypothetical protein